MPLTDTQIRKARALEGKAARLFDGFGLYLEIAPSGGKWYECTGMRQVRQANAPFQAQVRHWVGPL